MHRWRNSSFEDIVFEGYWYVEAKYGSTITISPACTPRIALLSAFTYRA